MTIGLFKACFHFLCHFRVTPERDPDISVKCVLFLNIGTIIWTNPSTTEPYRVEEPSGPQQVQLNINMQSFFQHNRCF